MVRILTFRCGITGQETLPFHVHVTSKEIKQLNKLIAKSTEKAMEVVFLQRLLICKICAYSSEACRR